MKSAASLAEQEVYGKVIIIFNSQFLVLNAKFLVFNTKLLVFNTNSRHDVDG